MGWSRGLGLCNVWSNHHNSIDCSHNRMHGYVWACAPACDHMMVGRVDLHLGQKLRDYLTFMCSHLIFTPTWRHRCYYKMLKWDNNWGSYYKLFRVNFIWYVFELFYCAWLFSFSWTCLDVYTSLWSIFNQNTLLNLLVLPCLQGPDHLSPVCESWVYYSVENKSH